jgi:hypothetical protein
MLYMLYSVKRTQFLGAELNGVVTR